MDNLHSLLETILDPDLRHVEPRAGQIGYVRAFAEPSSIDQAERTMRFVCSTKDIDRYGEIVEPEAFAASLATFMTNPIFVAGHVYIGTSGEPTTIGHWLDLKVTKSGLEGTARFLEGDELAEKYWLRYSKGVQRAVSVGWLTNAFEMREMPINGESKRVRVFTDVELIEISAVAIPAVRSALVRAASAMQVDEASAGGSALDALAKQLEPVIEKLIKKNLDASPGGHMAMLIADVCEQVLGHAGVRVGDDIYGSDVPEPMPDFEGDELNEELKNELRSIVS